MTRGRRALFVAFAFAVMADPVSSVAYALEAALHELGGDLDLLLPTMTVVLVIIGLVVVNYLHLVARYPGGGGAAAASGEAFGDAWAFLPLGALVVDFVLTIGVSVSAAGSALVAYVPALASHRMPLVLGLLVFVAGLTWFGHLGRVVFATMTLMFVGVAAVVLVFAAAADPVPFTAATSTAPEGGALAAVLLAFPVAMALATGVEAPSSAIAQLDELDDDGRRRFGRATLVLTVTLVGALTIGLVLAARRHGTALPGPDTTLVAELARAVSPGPVFAAFQLTTALLLLAAASSSFQAGPGLLKALAGTGGAGVLPKPLGRTNRRHTPYWSVLVFLGLSGVVVVAGGGRDQVLVLYYAVAVFVGFLVGLLAMVTFAARERAVGVLVLNAAGAVAVAFTLAVNLARPQAVASLAATLAVAALFGALWVRAGRPPGIRHTVGDGATSGETSR